jgi:CO/xanthine dehydrogenase FAD-binding subunit
VGGLTPRPLMVDAVGESLIGKSVTEENARAAAAFASDMVGDDAMGDLYASGEYRKRVLPVFVARALLEAAERAR